MIAYNVAHRITEIGVRIVLGATPANVIGQIVGEALRVIAGGAAAGLLIAFIVYIHVVPGGRIDGAVFLGVPAALLFVATAASWIPARSSARLDPMAALKQE